MSGISTKYPLEGCTLPFLWFEYGEEHYMANQVYPNWRHFQRLPLSPDADSDYQHHNRTGNLGPPAFTDWQLIHFLRTIKKGETKLSLLMYQGYGGDEITAHMVFLMHQTCFCDALGANVRVDYYPTKVSYGIMIPDMGGEFLNSHWSALWLSLLLGQILLFWSHKYVTNPRNVLIHENGHFLWILLKNMVSLVYDFCLQNPKNLIML